MKIDVTVPSVGESISEGFLNSWLAPDGSQVREGQAIFELETDKTSMEISSPATGQLNVSVDAGNDVNVGQVVGYVDTGVIDDAAATETGAKPELSSSMPEDVKTGDCTAAGTQMPDGKMERVTPAAKSAAKKRDIELSRLSGSGRNSMITRADVLDATQAGAQDAAGEKAGAENTSAGTDRSSGEYRKPLSRIRRLIAANLAQTRDEMVLLTTFNEADMSQIKTMRRLYGPDFMEHHEVKLGFMSFFIKASSNALMSFPEVNAYIDRNDIVYHNSANISVAISTSKGLITPVIRSVESMSFAEIEKKIGEYSKAAENKTLKPDDLAGGGFTVTNGGIFGSMMSTPLPVPGQSAILGMHAINDRPVVIDGQIEVRPMMYLALSYDHRLVDGREAVGFLKKIKDSVENPERLLLNV